MKNRKRGSLTLIALCLSGLFLVTSCASSRLTSQDNQDAPLSAHYDRLASLEFPGNYPTSEAADALYTELTFQPSGSDL